MIRIEAAHPVQLLPGLLGALVFQGRQGALALVEGPDGVGYIVKSGDALGNGRVTGITGTTVTFAVSAQPGQGPTTLTLRLVLD